MRRYMLRAVAHCKEGAWLLSRVRPETALGKLKRPASLIAYIA